MAGPPAAASEPAGARTHDGFYMRLGLGYGYMTTSVEVGPSEGTIKKTGTAFQFSAGGTPIPGLVIAGTIFTHVQSSPDFEVGGQTLKNDKSVFLLGLGPLVDFYPDPKGGFHVGGSLLYSTFNSINYTSTGFGIGAHAGYDLFFSNSWSVGPTVGLLYSKTSKDPEKDSSVSIVGMITVLDH
ncbi:MAG: autotransporter outer membrane beta-barrel domain-containing protein [Polyangiales bacterium]